MTRAIAIGLAKRPTRLAVQSHVLNREVVVILLAASLASMAVITLAVAAGRAAATYGGGTHLPGYALGYVDGMARDRNDGRPDAPPGPHLRPVG